MPQQEKQGILVLPRGISKCYNGRILFETQGGYIYEQNRIDQETD